MIVMKFGGTSVKDVPAVRRLIDIVRAHAQAGGRGLGVGEGHGRADRGFAPRGAGRRRRPPPRRSARCTTATRRWPSSSRTRSAGPSCWRRSTSAFGELETIVHALAVIEEVSPRSADTIVAFGELVSSQIVAAALTDAGVRAQFVDARQVLITDTQHGAAQPDRAQTDERLARLVAPLVEGRRRAGARRVHRRHGGGTSPRRSAAAVPTTRPRSSAPACARDEIQIWTDVDGMLTADPRVVDAPARRAAAVASTRPPSSPTSAPRCCTRARSCRRSASTFRCASSTRSGPRSQGTLITRRVDAAPTAPAGDRLQARRDASSTSPRRAC